MKIFSGKNTISLKKIFKIRSKVKVSKTTILRSTVIDMELNTSDSLEPKIWNSVPDYIKHVEQYGAIHDAHKQMVRRQLMCLHGLQPLAVAFIMQFVLLYVSIY